VVDIRHFYSTRRVADNLASDVSSARSKLLERKIDPPIQHGYLALHPCDYPICVNPNHKFQAKLRN
jgi:hypothetical protein